MQQNSQFYHLLFGILLIILTAIFGQFVQIFIELPTILILCLSVFLAYIISATFMHYLLYFNAPIESEAENSNKINTIDKGIIARHRFARLAINAIDSPILIIDEEKRLTIANKAARERFGIQNLGVRLESFMREPTILTYIDKTLEERVPQQFTWESFLPHHIFERVDISTFEYEGSQKIIIIISDETNMRLAEQVRVDFLANAGHELRTPLASIRGFLETIESTAKNDMRAINRFIPIMSREAERMSRLINDILSLSKIELNEHIMPKERLNLWQVLENCANSAEPSLKNNENELKLIGQNQNINIIGDTDEVQQVIVNLIDNAIKYGTKGKPINAFVSGPFSLKDGQIAAHEKWENSGGMSLCLPDETEKKFMLLRVENFGKGISNHYMPRLSERFYRIDDESAHIRGTGLGLAIVKHIIKRHNGGLFVESLVGDRTAFSVLLPCV